MLGTGGAAEEAKEEKKEEPEEESDEVSFDASAIDISYCYPLLSSCAFASVCAS